MAVFGKKSLESWRSDPDRRTGRRRLRRAGRKLRHQWFRRHRHRRFQLQAGRRDRQLCRAPPSSSTRRPATPSSPAFSDTCSPTARWTRTTAMRSSTTSITIRTITISGPPTSMPKRTSRSSAGRKDAIRARSSTPSSISWPIRTCGGGRRSAGALPSHSAGRRDGFRRSISIPSSICRTIPTWRRPASIRSSTFSRSVATRAARPTCRTSPSSARAGSTTPTISCTIRMSRQPASTHSSTS